MEVTASQLHAYDVRFGGMSLVWLNAHCTNRLDWIVVHLAYHANSANDWKEFLGSTRTLNNQTPTELGFVANYPHTALPKIREAIGYTLMNINKDVPSAPRIEKEFGCAGVRGIATTPNEFLCMPMVVFNGIQRLFQGGEMPLEAPALIEKLRGWHRNFLQARGGSHPNDLRCQLNDQVSLTFFEAGKCKQVTELGAAPLSTDADAPSVNPFFSYKVVDESNFHQKLEAAHQRETELEQQLAILQRKLEDEQGAHANTIKTKDEAIGTVKMEVARVEFARKRSLEKAAAELQERDTKVADLELAVVKAHAKITALETRVSEAHNERNRAVADAEEAKSAAARASAPAPITLSRSESASRSPAPSASAASASAAAAPSPAAPPSGPSAVYPSDAAALKPPTSSGVPPHPLASAGGSLPAAAPQQQNAGQAPPMQAASKVQGPPPQQQQQPAQAPAVLQFAQQQQQRPQPVVQQQAAPQQQYHDPQRQQQFPPSQAQPQGQPAQRPPLQQGSGFQQPQLQQYNTAPQQQPQQQQPQRPPGPPQQPQQQQQQIPPQQRPQAAPAQPQPIPQQQPQQQPNRPPQHTWQPQNAPTPQAGQQPSLQQYGQPPPQANVQRPPTQQQMPAGLSFQY